MSRPPLFRVGVAAVTALAAVLIRRLLDPVFGNHQPFILLYPAIVFVSLWGGVAAGLTCLAIGVLGVSHFVLDPRGSLAVADPHNQTAVVLVTVIGSAIVIVCGRVARRPSRSHDLGQSLTDLLRIRLPNSDGGEPAEADEFTAASPPVRVFHLLAYAPTGTRAIDHLVLEFARQAHSRGWHITFGFTARPPAEFADKLARLRAGWCLVPHPFTFRAARHLAQRFDRYRPDILQTSFHSAFDLPVLWLKLSGFARRLVVLDHASGTGPSASGPMALVRRVRGRLAGRVVDAVAPVSEYVARRDVERVFLPAHKVHPIPNGIDPARFPCPRRPAGRTPRVVFAGQLITEKGVDTLLEAAARLRLGGSSAAFELLIAGAGPLRERLEQAAAGAGLTDARFLGHVTDVPGLFGSADVVVVPSRWAEAFGYVAIEAMACGAAVLVSDAGALPEVVRDAGVVFRTGDPADLAVKLGGLLADPDDRQARGLAGRRLVEADYQLTTKVLRHFTLFMKVLPAGHPFAEEAAAPAPSGVLSGG